MIFHAWDSSFPFIFAVITADRDLAYALAMLRMKSYRVVLLSPAGAHTDLTSQASVHLDWSRTILGINDGSNEDDLFRQESPDRMAASVNAAPESINTARPSEQGTFTFTFRPDPPPPATSRNDSGLPHKPPVFSGSYDQGLDMFGGPRSSPKSSYGLGSGPLFPRSWSNQKPLRSRSGSLPDFSWPTAFAKKGKNKASEPEEIELPPPSKLRSSTYIFEPFDDDKDGGFPSPQPSPGPAMPEPAVSPNSSQSRQSKFSFEHISQPTGVSAPEPPVQSKLSPPKEASPRLSNEPVATTVSSVPQVKKKTKQPPPLVVVLSAKPKKKTPKVASTIAAPRLPPVSGTSNASVPLPPAWAPLIQTLRRHNCVLPRSTIAVKLLDYYPGAFKTAGAKNIKGYLDGAISAGIVLKSNPGTGFKIHLRSPYSR